jgi:hypothetical protein
MSHASHYASVSEAITALQAQGFTTDFNLAQNCIVCATSQFAAEAFDIVDVYRYEGDSDPADEATVYAIMSNTGIKGLLVTGYGVTTDDLSASILEKLTIR